MAAPNPLRDAILDAIDGQDETVKAASAITAGFAQYVAVGMTLAGAVAHPEASLEAVAGTLSPEYRTAMEIMICHHACQAEAHAVRHSGAMRAAGRGRDEGPVTRQHLGARRAARGMPQTK